MLLITTINEMYSLVPAVVWTTASSLLQDSISPETLEIAHRSTEHKTRGQASGHGFRRFLTGSNGALALAARGESQKQFPWRMFRRKIALWRWEHGVASRKNSGLQLAPWRALPAIRFMSG
jgi:hypothetical protein